jgi:hypothetical protein
MSKVELIAHPDDGNHFDVKVSWGEPVDLPEHTDGGAIERGIVSVSYLTRLQAEPRSDLGGAEKALEHLLT